MLTGILMVTLAVPDIIAAEHAYTDWLGFRVIERSNVTNSLAAQWGAPLAAGSRSLLLQCASGDPVFTRLVERPSIAGYAAMHTHGWNSNEILVEDPAVLEQRFQRPDAPFKVIGTTAPLASNPAIVAMQAIGPAGELNYFTRIPPEGGTFIKTPAKAFVDRTFIVVLGGPNMSAMQSFYREVLDQNVTPAYASTIGVLQNTFGLPAATQFAISLVPISAAFLIELDEYPPNAHARPHRQGDLPPGMSIVSFTTDDIDALPREHWRVAPDVREESPYNGRRTGMLVGAAGEWLEIVGH